MRFSTHFLNALEVGSLQVVCERGEFHAHHAERLDHLSVVGVDGGDLLRPLVPWGFTIQQISILLL